MLLHLPLGRRSRESGNPDCLPEATAAWIPAFAGMTGRALSAFAAVGLVVAFTSHAVLAQAERPRPSATEYVATVETLIEACSRAKPADAMRYSEVRDIVNNALPKKNYAEIQATTLYKQIRERFVAEVRSVPQTRLLQECGALDRLIEAKPEDLGLRDQ